MLSTMLASAGSSSLFSSAAPSLLILLKNGPAVNHGPAIAPGRRGVSHLASSSDKASSGPQPGDKASAVQQIKKAFIPRGTAASHLRSFAAQPALAEDSPMFCVSWLLQQCKGAHHCRLPSFSMLASTAAAAPWTGPPGARHIKLPDST